MSESSTCPRPPLSDTGHCSRRPVDGLAVGGGAISLIHTFIGIKHESSAAQFTF